MSFYEVIYETPVVDEVSAGKKRHQLPNLRGFRETEVLNADNC